MKYINASDILPDSLLHELQKYIHSAYLYIPTPEPRTVHTTAYQWEIKHRDRKIYRLHLEGMSNSSLSSAFHLSQSSIRRIISQHRKRYHHMKDHLTHILENWKIPVYMPVQVHDTTWDLGNKYILKVYQDKPSMLRNIHITSHLHRMNIPVGVPVETVDGQLYVEEESNFYILSTKLSGSNLVDFRKEKGVFHKVGQILAHLHVALRQCEKEITFWDNSLLNEIKGWVQETLEADQWTVISKDSFYQTSAQLEAIYPDLPVQLIHRDVHFGNFLFDNGNFSGYIDFDLSQRNIRIFDLCYFLLGLMSQNEAMPIFCQEWLDAVSELFDGYSKSLTISPQELKAVPVVMKSIELLFIAWSVSQNDLISAQNAAGIYQFVENNADSILFAVHGKREAT